MPETGPVVLVGAGEIAPNESNQNHRDYRMNREGMLNKPEGPLKPEMSDSAG